ncbi:NUDIX hydrolase [Tunicatimonas pelagia]|uniref:NUDIX hydrolase n=1 Tax=Tunicatimonas pelagia TaxID=931531 RepID=UPI0026660CCB|nr:NUDIX domain-containing protein [Tunicatimonas pelagia]WKN45565.1 NUDIX domain-containing protein [Tunicatimonas pelagia]
MEEWDLYDQHRIRTGKVVKRGKIFNPNEFHLVIHVCIINSNNQLLIQQRQPFKEGWENMWDLTVGGSAHAGETSNQAAERELFEEIGYKADLSTIRPVFTVNFNRGFDDYYILKADINLEKLSLQVAEVKRWRWSSFKIGERRHYTTNTTIQKEAKVF